MPERKPVSEIWNGNGCFTPFAINNPDHYAVGTVADFDLKIAEGISARFERTLPKLLADQITGNPAQELVLQTLRVRIEGTGRSSSGFFSRRVGGAVLGLGRTQHPRVIERVTPEIGIVGVIDEALTLGFRTQE